MPNPTRPQVFCLIEIFILSEERSSLKISTTSEAIVRQRCLTLLDLEASILSRGVAVFRCNVMHRSLTVCLIRTCYFHAWLSKYYLEGANV